MPDTKENDDNPFYEPPTLKRARSPSPETTRVAEVAPLRVPLMDITPLVLKQGDEGENEGYEGEDEDEDEEEDDAGAGDDAENSIPIGTSTTHSDSDSETHVACLLKTAPTCLAFLASRNCLPPAFDGDFLGDMLPLPADAPIEELAAALVVLEREVERLQDEFVRRLRADVVQGRSAAEALEELWGRR